MQREVIPRTNPERRTDDARSALIGQADLDPKHCLTPLRVRRAREPWRHGHRSLATQDEWRQGTRDRVSMRYLPRTSSMNSAQLRDRRRDAVPGGRQRRARQGTETAPETTGRCSALPRSQNSSAGGSRNWPVTTPTDTAWSQLWSTIVAVSSPTEWAATIQSWTHGARWNRQLHTWRPRQGSEPMVDGRVRNEAAGPARPRGPRRAFDRQHSDGIHQDLADSPTPEP